MCLIQQLPEHLNAGGYGLARLVSKANDGNFVSNLDYAALYTTGSNSSTSSDGEYVFNWHQEWLVNVPLWGGNVFINSIHESLELSTCFPRSSSLQLFQSLQSAASDHRNVVARELVLAEKFPNFHLYQFEKLRVVHHICLVQPHNDGRHAYLASKENVLPSLRHRTISSRDNQDCAVHLRRTGNHVLDVVRVTWAVDVGVVPLFCLILHVGSIDGDAALPFFWSIVDFFEPLYSAGITPGEQHRDCSSSCSLAVVDVTNGTHVYVRLSPFKLLFCHFSSTPP